MGGLGDDHQAVLQVPAAINQDIKALRPSQELDTDYLHVALTAMNRTLMDLVERSSHDTRRLQTRKLLNVLIKVPSRSEQRRIVLASQTVWKRLDEMTKMRTNRQDELSSLMASAIQKGFSGGSQDTEYSAS